MLKNKVALVTGAGSGIGKAIAIALGGAGAHVHCVSRTQSDLDETQKIIEAAGGTATAISADVTIPKDVLNVAKQIAAEKRGLNLAFLNAGGNVQKATIVDSDFDEFRRAIDLNLLSVFYGIKTVIPLMREVGGGRIIFTGTAMAHYPTAGRSSYGAGKAGARMVARTAAAELQGENITVNELIPGPVRSRQTMARFNPDEKSNPMNNPNEWVKDPEDVVDLAMFLATSPGKGPTGQIFSLARR